MMRELKIKTEKPARRCEICHQSDRFDARKNNCARCANLAATLVTVTTDRAMKANFSGPVLRFFGWHTMMTDRLTMVRWLLIGGLIGSFALMMTVYNPMKAIDSDIQVCGMGVMYFNLDESIFLHILSIVTFGGLIGLVSWLNNFLSLNNLHFSLIRSGQDRQAGVE